MSYITDVVVVVDYLSREAETRLTSPLPFDVERRHSLKPIDMDRAGGTKVFCSKVYAAAFNYLQTEEFVPWVTEVLADAINPVVWMSTEGDFVEVFCPDGIVRGAVGGPESGGDEGIRVSGT